MSYYKILFVIVLIIKIGITLLVVPALYFHWFIPFIKNFVSLGFINPWDSFLAGGGYIKAFPYGTGMLVILSIPFALKSIVANISPEVVTKIDIILLRIPVLLADIGIFYMLIHSFKLDVKRTVYIYWCSPVVLYIGYFFGQLDMIPMAILLLSLVLLFNHRYISSAFALSIGVATKENLLVAAPFLITYIFRKEHYLPKVLLYLTASFLLYILMIGPFFFSQGYQSMVFNAEERDWIYLTAISFGNYNLLLVPLALGVLFLKFGLYKKLNNDILIMYIGLVFTVFLLLIPANAPGWYMWVIPFLCYYYIHSQKFHPATYIVFSILFILYFTMKVPYPLNIIHPESKSILFEMMARYMSEIRSIRLIDTTATLLFGIIAYIAIMMYIYGVRSNQVYKERETPVIVGIAGSSGAGKDTLCGFLKNILGEKNIIQVDGDDHHKWERDNKMWKVYTHLNPKGNDLYIQMNHTSSLKNGQTISRRSYNHTTGKFSEPHILGPNKYIFLSGLHPYYLSMMRELIDIKIYLDTEEELVKFWKVKRDTEERGYKKEHVIDYMKKRESDNQKFIEPQRSYADIIIRYETVDALSSERINDNSQLRVKFTLDNSINIEQLINELGEASNIKLNHWYEGVDKQHLVVEGGIASEGLEKTAIRIIPNIDELGIVKMQFEDDLNGIVQIVILCVFSYTMLYEKL